MCLKGLFHWVLFGNPAMEVVEAWYKTPEPEHMKICGTMGLRIMEAPYSEILYFLCGIPCVDLCG